MPIQTSRTVETTSDLSGLHQGDGARLLRDHDGHGVGVIAEADGRPVAGAHAAVLGIVGHGQHATGGDDLAVAAQDVGVERAIGVDDRATFDEYRHDEPPRLATT